MSLIARLFRPLSAFGFNPSRDSLADLNVTVSKMEMSETDILVLVIPKSLGPRQVDAIRPQLEALRSSLGLNNKVVVLTDGMKLSAVSKDA